MNQKIPTPTASTQDHLDIEDVIDDLLILKTGWIALVVNTTAVNFDLLSEAEQDATIYAYGAFLNSLTFPIEILIRSKKADISEYFQALAEAEKMQPNPDLKRQIQKYEDFIQATVQQRTVLDKKFYIVISYSPVETGFGMIGKKTSNAKVKGAVLEAAKASLYPRRDHVAKQLARLGLSARQLTSQELVELLYDIYNPAPTGTQRVLLDSAAYTAPLVEPAIENPAPAKIEHEFKKPEELKDQKAGAIGRLDTPESQNAGEIVRPEAGLMPHAEVSVGQQQSVVDVGLRPVPPGGGIGTPDKPDVLGSQKVGEVGIPEDQKASVVSGQTAGQPPSQVDALKELQRAVAEAEKLAGTTSQVPSGGLDLRDSSEPAQGVSSGDDKGTGGFKI